MLTAIAIFFAVIGTGWFVLYCISYAMYKRRERKQADHVRKYFERAEKEERVQNQGKFPFDACPPTTENLVKGCRYPNCNCGPLPGSHAD